MRSSWLAGLFALCASLSSASQAPLAVDSTLFNGGLNSLSTSEFTTFSHPAISGKLRIKKHHDFCDTTVKSYSGYLDAAHGTQHMFFYFFESRNAPDTDPVVMWINGGPGCSSSTGLFMELGPCQVSLDGNSTKFNPYSWNSNTNIFFLDQPVGVGFSYSDFGIEVGSTEDAAPVVQQFVSLFFETFSQFKGRPFHITGESYGGRYIPVFASEIIDQNAKASAKGLTPINLQSIAIGNGMTNAPELIPTWYDIQCTNASVVPFQSISNCVAMKKGLPLCHKLMRENCEDIFDTIGCTAAFEYCSNLVFTPFLETGRNPYDVTKMCFDEGSQDGGCYEISIAIDKYLNKPEIRSKLGVPKTRPAFAGCSERVNTAFNEHTDIGRTSEFHMAQLLERGVRVLLYDGVLDLFCNHIGYYRLAESLQWAGHDEFKAAELREWTAPSSSVTSGEESPAGKTKGAAGGLLTWATVYGAGHMVPYDKPAESLAMINRWIAGEDL